MVYIIINIFFQTNIKCEESFITLKINKPGLHKILFSGIQDSNHKCYGVDIHTPISMEINNEPINPHVFEYNFTERENTIKLFFQENKTDYKCLFCECSDIDEIDASHLITSEVRFFNLTFFKCNSLTSLNISNFNTEKVRSMRGIFRGCSSLTSIDVSNFITTSLVDMSFMFDGCNKLKSINVLNFDTSNVLFMDSLFRKCYSLTSLNVSNFKTSKVKWMAEMFRGCVLLKSLDLSNFDTSSVQNFYQMFDSCESLVSLDLSNFNTEKANETYGMFQNCKNLIYLNISGFNTSLIKNMTAMFFHCEKLKSLDLSHFDFSQVIDIANMFAFNYDLNYINLKNLVIKSDTNYMSLFDNYLTNPIICIDDEESLNKIISLFHPKNLNEDEDWGEYKNNIVKNENIYKEGYLLSKCEDKCYQICSNYFYYDNNKNKYICTDKLECPTPYDKLIHGRNECIKSCNETIEHKTEITIGLIKKCMKANPKPSIIECSKYNPFLLIDTLECVPTCTIKQRQNKLCITNHISKNEDKDKILDKIISQAKDELISNFDKLIFDGNVINENKLNISLTRTKKENTDDNDINLGECEDRLKNFYEIISPESLYILKVETEKLGLKVPSLKYEVYYPLNGNNNLTKLDLTICKDIKINRTISIDITGNIDKYNKKSSYYNDICYIAESDEGADISLSDRKEDFIDNNMGICDDECELSSYNYETKKAICSCDIITEIPLVSQIRIDKKALLKSFTEVNNILNIQILKCYKVVFQKNNILKNNGFFIFAVLIILNLICFFYFVLKGFNNIVNKITKMKKYFLKNKRQNKNISCYNISKKRNKNKNINILNSSEKLDMNNNINNKNKINEFFSPPKNKKKLMYNKKNRLKIDNISDKYSNEIMNDNIRCKKVKKISLNYNEINHLTFDEALNKDNRTFFQYYLSLIKSNHLILFIFNSEDYNSKTIKITIFIFNIASSLFINSLFFDDSTMHKFYINNGSFKLIYQLPQIIYSTIISEVLNFLINLLGLSESNILKIKNESIPPKDIDKKFDNLFKILKAKFIFFFIINISFLFIFWYYVTCFCGIYRNTQIHLFKDFLFSFITSIILPFILYLIPGIFRICAIKRKNKMLYKFSKILQTI